MSAYTADKIRNICLLGHGGEGKTSLVESMLYMTKGTDRLGKVSEGNTVSDYDPEEIKRKFSISMSIAPVEFKDHKINVLDCPGFFDFEGEVLEALRVADAGIVTFSAKGGLSVGSQKAWRKLGEAKKPRLIYISKLDEENADFYKAVAAAREKLGISVCPVVIPVMEGDKAGAIIDVVSKKAYIMEGPTRTEIPVPESMIDRMETYYGMLCESVAETSEELMEKYFDGEEFTQDEMREGLHQGVLAGDLAPVFCGSAFTGIGTLALLRGIIDYVPNPMKALADATVDAEGNETEYKLDAAGKPALFVFNTMADQYGRFSYFKVMRGDITPDLTMKNARSEIDEKLGHIYTLKGKKTTEVDRICCGDIGAVAKLVDTKTNDTLYTGAPIAFKKINFPRTCYSVAITAKSKGAEDKIANGIARLRDEDPLLKSTINPETHQQVISGMGDIHLDVVCSKLKNKFGVEVATEPARIAYREKIRKKVQAEGKHKKQSGGHGQYGHVKMEFEPCEEENFIFEERVFGGSVPKNFFPAVEKGIVESMQRGVLAGYPLVGLKATLFDGSYHDVDSNELSFKVAARLAYKAGIPQANPVIMEPYAELKVTVPEKYMGDIIGDLNKRRGRVMGMDPTGDGMQVITAEVPMAEMQSYAIELRSMTRGWGAFVMDFIRYEDTPPVVQAKVIEDAKAFNLAEDDE